MVSEKIINLTHTMYTGKFILDLNSIYDYIYNKEDYDYLCEFVVNYILDDYSRAYNSIIIIDENKKEIEITVFQLVINLYILEFAFKYRIPITRDWLVDVDKQFLANWHNFIEDFCQTKIMPIIKKKKLDSGKCLSDTLSSITERITKLTELISPITTPTLNLFDLADFCNRNTKFNSLLSTELDDTKTFHQLEQELSASGKELKKTILDDGQSCLVPFVESNCLKEQQMTQLFVAVGPRMSSTNVVMPHVMKTSYLNGLKNVGDYIAESEIAAKALIYKKKFVSVSGYMSRESNLSAMNLSIDYNMNDCGTIHYINYNVATKKHLNFIISKNIILSNGKLHEVTAEDTDLIGTTVKLRSICCCAHSNRHMVCKTCYGNPKDFKTNYKIGGATSTEIQNPLSNAVMAVKHSSGTKTKEFDNEALLKLFNNVNSKMILKHLDESENVSIYFNKEYIEDVIDRLENDQYYDDDDDDDEPTNDDDDLENNTVASNMLTDLSIVTRTYDKLTNEEKEDVYEVKLDGCFLTLSEEMMKLQNIKKLEIPIDSDIAILNLKDLKPGMGVFNIKYVTAETSRYLKALKNIIERPRPMWYTNLDDPINEYTDLVIEAGLSNKEMVYIEPIIHALTRRPDNILGRPDFSKPSVPLMVINLRTSLVKGDFYSAQLYQEITKLFKDRDSFFKDESIGDGLNDSLFKTSIKHDFTYMKRALRKSKLI